MFKKLRKNDKKGFTLIEILVVIALIGVLAAIAVPRLSGVQAGVTEKADIVAAQLWLKEIDQMYMLGKVKDGDKHADIIKVSAAPKMQSTGATIVAEVSATGVLTIVYDPDGTGAKAAVNIHEGTGFQLTKVN